MPVAARVYAARRRPAVGDRCRHQSRFVSASCFGEQGIWLWQRSQLVCFWSGSILGDAAAPQFYCVSRGTTLR